MVTPNIVEAEGIIDCLLAGDLGSEEDVLKLERRQDTNGRQTEGTHIKSLEDMIDAAKTIQRLTPSSSTQKSTQNLAVLIKGGHLPLTSKQLTEGLSNLEKKHAERTVVWSDNVDALDGRETYTEVLESHRRALHMAGTAAVSICLGDASTMQQNGQQAIQEEEQKYVIDILLDASHLTLYIGQAIESTSTHGTGCTLSAAIASELALGQDRESLGCSWQIWQETDRRSTAVDSTRSSKKSYQVHSAGD